MPITHNPGGSTTLTGDSINFYRLAMLKGALKLEIKGIKMMRGRSAYALIKQEFGVKGSRETVLAWMEATVEAHRRQQEHVTPDGTRLVDGQEVQ